MLLAKKPTGKVAYFVFTDVGKDGFHTFAPVYCSENKIVRSQKISWANYNDAGKEAHTHSRGPCIFQHGTLFLFMGQPDP
jgi:hypothetical protein